MGDSFRTNLGTATVDSNGVFSITSSTLNEGSYELTATATDSADNTSEPSSELFINVGNYIFQTKTDLINAISTWIDDQDNAEITYGEINTWDVSSITDFSELFQDKTSFNADISNWNVSNGTYFEGMFSNAREFNQDIGITDPASGPVVIDQSGLVAEPGKTITGKLKV